MAACKRRKGVRIQVRNIGSDNIWFEFAGHRCTEYDVRMLSMPTRPHPARKGNLIDVPGRDGKLFVDGAADDRSLVTLRVIAVGDIDAVNGWLTGSGLLVFGDFPNRAYYASVTKEFSMSNRIARLRGQEFTITFDCDPFRYEYPEPGPVSIVTSGEIINNPGTVYSLPKVKITGNGDFTLVVNGYQIDGYGITGGAIIDCELMDVFNLDETEMLNSRFTIDDFPRLDPGANIVSWMGDGISSVEITPRWRFL